MNFKEQNEKIVADYSKVATMSKALIFCALSENEQGNIQIYLSRIQDADTTCKMLENIIGNIKLRQMQGGKK